MKVKPKRIMDHARTPKQDRKWLRVKWSAILMDRALKLIKLKYVVTQMEITKIPFRASLQNIRMDSALHEEGSAKRDMYVTTWPVDALDVRMVDQQGQLQPGDLSRTIVIKSNHNFLLDMKLQDNF